ncbi:MAG: nucleotide exchange factor GrpE [Gammaproteobacteria bacterium]|nr:nucleotide exchange factor GrpE [Rhodocyclaceae bacterium]MBU3908723.1 nucleotide exchange factor GrpE [Gammaproteobacteria bacterium]MBU3988845.1 nucleotide exchange factor GrpE [Gammaproteobacteria bacterium]MBU4004751.1 nucleotide exchange factor GrpE [Gammaproteobacteria bacterium]MBU4021354.1 nucleotide exchange factor GrpE [Gammaproteobacteria bacterium]
MQETKNLSLSEQEAEIKDANAETSSEAAGVESTPSPAELLKAAELKAAESHDAWLRAKADTENLRRRAQEDVTKAHKFAAEKFAGELLAVKDSLEAALAIETQTAEALRAGVELTLRQLNTAFEKSAVAELNPLGEKFDPHFHQAIAMVDAEQEPNTVVSVLQKGYALHERILRPALVTVAKPKD